MGCDKFDQLNKERCTDSEQGSYLKEGGHSKLDPVQQRPQLHYSQTWRGEETKTGRLGGLVGLVVKKEGGGNLKKPTKFQPEKKLGRDEGEIDSCEKRNPLGPNKHSNEDIRQDIINRLKLKLLDQ